MWGMHWVETIRVPIKAMTESGYQLGRLFSKLTHTNIDPMDYGIFWSEDLDEGFYRLLVSLGAFDVIHHDTDAMLKVVRAYCIMRHAKLVSATGSNQLALFPIQRFTGTSCVVHRSFRLLSADYSPTCAPVPTLRQSPLSHVIHRAEIVTSGTGYQNQVLLAECH
jgi:hypothetical protein